MSETLRRMWRLAFKNLVGRKGRFALTSLAIIAGTAFLAGVLIFTTTLQQSFDQIFAKAYANTDVVVRSSNVVEGRFDELRDDLPATILDAIRSVPGVRSASPVVQEPVTIARADTGVPIRRRGRDTFGASWDPEPTSPWEIAEGRPPAQAGELVLDRATARDAALGIGDRVSIRLGNGRHDATIVGIATFGGADTMARSSWALMPFEIAAPLLLGKEGSISSVVVRSDGSAADADLASTIETTLAAEFPDAEAITGAAATQDERSSVERGLEFFSIFLTTFAMISLFVSSFVIFNVFSVAQTQRTREHALLRAIGAARRQLVKVLLGEALIVGIVGSILGFVAGIGVAVGLTNLLPRVGVTLTATALVISARSLLTVVAVGTVVTVLCAIVPALRSGRVPPLAAVRDVALERKAVTTRRIITGVVLLAASSVFAVLHLSGGPILLLAGAVVVLYVGLAVLSPAIAEPLAVALRRPMRRLGGVTGTLAADNSARNPRRTALTSSALMIGLSLMIAISTMGSSIEAQSERLITSKLRGDLIVSAKDRRGSFGSIPRSVSTTIAGLPEVESSAGIAATFLAVESQGRFEARTLLVIDPPAFEKVVDLTMTSGRLTDLDQNGIVISARRARRGGMRVGDTLRVQLLDQRIIPLTVRGIFDSELFRGSYIVDRSLIDHLVIPALDAQIFVDLRSDVSVTDGKRAIDIALNSTETLTVRTPEEQASDDNQELRGQLNFVYGLLGMSIFVATLGIVITLVLSIHERRREIAMLRAIGMTKSQLRSTVRWESVIITMIGAVLGMLSGLLVGWLVVRALRERGLEEFTVSPRSLAVFVVLAVVLGVAAAIIPARRAAKSDILSGIATG